MGRRQPVLDAWSALPGTGRESKGGELGGTSEEHEEGIPEGPASFHRAAHDRLCRSATPHAGWPVWLCVFLLKTCGSKVLLGGRCGPESRISRLFAALPVLVNELPNASALNCVQNYSKPQLISLRA